MVGILVSFSHCPFSGAMLVSGRVSDGIIYWFQVEMRPTRCLVPTRSSRSRLQLKVQAVERQLQEPSEPPTLTCLSMFVSTFDLYEETYVSCDVAWSCNVNLGLINPSPPQAGGCAALLNRGFIILMLTLCCIMVCCGLSHIFLQSLVLNHRRKWWWWESNVSWKCHLFHSMGTARAGWHRCKMVKSYPSILQQNFRLAKDSVKLSSIGKFLLQGDCGRVVPTAWTGHRVQRHVESRDPRQM